MTITKTEKNGAVTLEINGWLDVETTPQLHEFMETLPECGDLVFDFKDLEYISSAGVREVVAAYRRQKEEGGTFAAVNLSPDVFEVFSLTGLDKKLDIRKAE